MTAYDEVIKAIEQGNTSFGPYGRAAASDESITNGEKELGLSFPASYLWWLKHYDGGEIGSDTIYAIDADGMGKPDIVDFAVTRDDFVPGHVNRLYFGGNDDEMYYFDIASGLDENSEYKVYLFDHLAQTDELYADSFADFLIKRINE
ncbi:SMI1/KNR4 family protein [Microbulbifer sp. MLAF003]|uniref:SMI1/KNR4 family protein n=1 Tax=Microbulbifer sp. MLAF003 TaxID=3032582 RepID=UPI0024ACF642|nr:SMI1/KNR4 family protein [Microbulbifer sp. MLAF003]WHI52166.1 SMI1/KNR4 family protein [Microbulbifer sp. MLAF003]